MRATDWTPGDSMEASRPCFGTKGSQVRILSPRPVERVGVARISRAIPGPSPLERCSRNGRRERVSWWQQEPQGASPMKLKRLFQVLVLGGTSLLAASACGGSDSNNNNNNTPPLQSLLPDG